jgi:hypothetical protein
MICEILFCASISTNLDRLNPYLTIRFLVLVLSQVTLETIVAVSDGTYEYARNIHQDAKMISVVNDGQTCSPRRLTFLRLAESIVSSTVLRCSLPYYSYWSLLYRYTSRTDKSPTNPKFRLAQRLSADRNGCSDSVFTGVPVLEVEHGLGPAGQVARFPI